jgi:hypothetical protein
VNAAGVVMAWWACRPAARPIQPQTILKRRYAAGEIDRDLYLQILQELDED